MTNKPDELERATKPQPITLATGPARALPAIVRAHLVEPGLESLQVLHEGAPAAAGQDQYWPDLVLVFDTETATDEFASLRFGTYIVEWLDPLPLKVTGSPEESIERWDAGFFTGESLNDAERAQIEAYCAAHGLTCLTRREWLEKVFFTIGYRGRGAIVGFNLPFDLSRVATRASVIRLKKEGKLAGDGSTKSNWINRFYAGGWRLVFNEREKKDQPGQWRERAYRPPALLKPINTRAVMYRWGRFLNWQDRETPVPWPYGKDRKNQAMQSCEPAQPAAQRQRRQEKSEDQLQPEKDRNQKEPASDRFYAGHFLDLRTLGLALSKDEDGSLRSLGELFGAQVLKTESHEHGGELSEAYLDYAMNDAEATLALYWAEMEEYKKHGLDATPDRIYSGASLGKAYLKQMGISSPPSMIADGLPYSPDELAGFGMSAYYSGRSEAQVVKTPVPVTYVDFHSMYPAVNILQGLWDFMRAGKIKVSDATGETAEFLENIRPDDLYDPSTWKRLPVLCLVEPQGDVLPVRADYRWRKPQTSHFQHRIAQAEIASAKEPMWYALADCVASLLSTGKPPRILAALKFTPEGSRLLQPVSIRGGVAIDPDQEDFFRALVEARDNTNDPSLAQALKIVANSTSYGIWAEVGIEEGERLVAAFSAGQRAAVIPHGEKPGRYYCPPLAAFITAGARLMLKLLEFEIEARGGASAFCDTDSLAIISSQAGGRHRYRDHHKRLRELPLLTWTQVDEVLRRFESLNPYRSGKPLIKLEPENFDENKNRVDLQAWVNASKRYALYTILPDGTIRIVKASYHTLGIVEPPRDENGNEIKDWIEKVWEGIIIRREFSPPWAAQPVEVHLDIGSPEIWKSFRKLWAGKGTRTGNKWMDKYLDSIKPFNFVAVLVKSRVGRAAGEADESRELADVPVIAPLAPDGRTKASRRWIAKKDGRPVSLLRPGKIWLPRKGLSEEELQRRALAEIDERRAFIKRIEKGGGLVAVPMTFAEFVADFRGQHERGAEDLYGGEVEAGARGQLARPRVTITELHFTGKETVLQEELENGIVSTEEVEAYRFMIGPERDPAAEGIQEVLRLLSKVELRRLKISRREADQIKDSEEPLALDEASAGSRFVEGLVKYLGKHYPDETGEAVDEAALRAFVENRRRLLEQWQAAKLQLSEMPTKELMQIAGCSRRNAIYIKRGEVEPRIETIRKIVLSWSKQ